MDNLEIEAIGTKLVIEYEHSCDRKTKQLKSPGCGWDICTGNENEIRYIEIKTTSKSKLVGRWIERCGYEQLMTNPNFYIYGVTECKEDGSGKIEIYTKDNITITEDVKYVMKFNKSRSHTQHNQTVKNK